MLFSTSAPLYNRLYEQGLLNSSFGSFYSDGPGCAFLVAEGESRDPERVRDEVLKEAARLGSEGVDQELWDRLKRRPTAPWCAASTPWRTPASSWPRPTSRGRTTSASPGVPEHRAGRRRGVAARVVRGGAVRPVGDRAGGITDIKEE